MSSNAIKGIHFQINHSTIYVVLMRGNEHAKFVKFAFIKMIYPTVSLGNIYGTAVVDTVCRLGNL